MSIDPPKVSVLMTIYNGMPYLKESIPALLNQEYSNLELVLVDDASTDDSFRYLNSLKDPRIFTFQPGKLGRGKALNYGLSKCTGKYVAINDADDLSFQDRIKKQVAFLEKHEDYGLVGANFIKQFSGGKQIKSDKPLTDSSLKMGLSKHSVIQHSAVTFRKSVLDQIGGYNLSIPFLYDRDIYIRVAQISKIANLPDHLVQINRHEQQFFNANFKGWKRKIFTLQYNLLAIQKLKLPKYLYISRTIEFLIRQSIDLIKSAITYGKG